jgi:hypothetical protein
LEHLEPRNLPSVAANDAFVATLYQGLLGRNTDPGGLVYWDGRLNAGASRADVALGIEKSDESIGRAVQIFYDDFLGRPADSAGLNFWVESVRRGATLEQVKVNILGSDEFFTRAGGNLGAFLNAVSRAELGRGVDPTGLAYFSGTPNNPGGRAAAAFNIITSPEGEQVKLNGIYRLALNRAPDNAGSAYWLGLIQQGTRTSEVVAGVVGSDEYFASVQRFAATANDPNSAAHQFIAGTNRFGATLPGAEQLNATIVTDPSLVLPPPPTPQPILQVVQTPVFAPDYFVAPTPFFFDAPVFFDPNPPLFYDPGPPLFFDPGPPDFGDFFDFGWGDCGCGGGFDLGF